VKQTGKKNNLGRERQRRDCEGHIGTIHIQYMAVAMGKKGGHASKEEDIIQDMQKE
jgi:hypothetical protein